MPPWLMMLGLALCGPPSWPVEAGFSYLYIEANTGASSGGHTAAVLEDKVYHFENAHGRLLLRRDDWSQFQHLYSDLENRDIHSGEIPMAPVDLERIERHLIHLLLEQQERLAHLEALQNDQALLSSLQNRTPLSIKGMGFSAPVPAKLRQSPDPAIRAIQERVEPAFLQQKLKQTLKLQQSFRFRKNPAPDFSPPLLPIYPATFSDQWLGLLQMERAIRTLLGEFSLSETITVDAGPLDDWSHRTQATCDPYTWLRKYQILQIESISRQIKGSQAVSTLPLLRSIARLEAASRSLATGRLLLIKPDTTQPEGVQTEKMFSPDLQKQLAEDTLSHTSDLLRASFCEEPPDEILLHKLEVAISELHEVQEANLEKRPVRIFPEPGLQEAAAETEVWTKTLDHPPTQNEMRVSEEAVLTFEEDLDRRYRYDLINQNCVTRILEAVNGTFELGDETSVMGGRINPHASQAFIPYRFFELVKARYKLQKISQFPSFRSRWLEQLKNLGDPDWSWFKEQTTLTSEIYVPRSDDGLFLFFTDKIAWLRPPEGIVNFGYGLGGALIGLVSWPLDTGDLLISGGKGMLFSIPEIAGWNIRKGSFSELGIRKRPDGGL